MTKKQENYLLVVLFIVLIILCALWVDARVSSVSQEENVIVSQKKVKRAQRRLQVYLEKVQTEVLNEGVNSSNRQLREIALQNTQTALSNDIGKSFFAGYFSWSNSKSFLQRKEKLKGLIDSNLYNNDELFSNDVNDSTGNNYIKALGLTSKFNEQSSYIVSNNKDNLTFITNVEYSGKLGTTNKINNIAQQTFEVIFSKTQGKIINIQKLNK